MIINIILILNSIILIPQSNDLEKARKFREIEKIKIKIEKAQEYLNNRSIIESINTKNKSKNSDNLLSQNEKIVANEQLPESEVFAAINPTDSNNIVLSPIQLGLDKGQSLMCPVYYTKNLGLSWTRSTFKSLPLRDSLLVVGGGDPVMVFDANGRLYFSWINIFLTYINLGSENLPVYTIDSLFEGIFYAYSDDGGATFTFDNSMFIGQKLSGGKYIKDKPVDLTFFLDKQWMAADMSNSKFRGNVYLSALNLNFDDETFKMILFRKNACDNYFLENPTVFNKNFTTMNQFGNVDVDSKGIIHCTYFSSPNKLYYTSSTDGGETFKSEITISKTIDDLDSTYIGGLDKGRIYFAPHFAIDKSGTSSDGYMYITWTGVKPHIEIYLSRSIDNGRSWSSPIIVNDSSAINIKDFEFYPNITVNPNGVVAIGYYKQKSNQPYCPTDYWVSLSYDRGKTFSRHVKVSSFSSQFTKIGNQNEGFGIGEYNSLVSTKKYIIPVWADGRLNDGNINIFFARILVNSDSKYPEEITNVSDSSGFFSVSPNPASDIIVLNFTVDKIENASIKIYDLNGLLVSKPIESVNIINKTTVEISELSTGVYFVEVLSDKYKGVKKFQINRN